MVPPIIARREREKGMKNLMYQIHPYSKLMASPVGGFLHTQAHHAGLNPWPILSMYHTNIIRMYLTSNCPSLENIMNQHQSP
ncbi:hypothetical protein HYC85_016925 [Camellia sinensis]|uniref:Uncharacterized protein n=1 Tax=Camellia sinensis TaxID=4442 RepID=A0A7J7H286_CAMSI|nr:hypothetical protein HYC85_016925 [Camellia sinensis]